MSFRVLWISIRCLGIAVRHTHPVDVLCNDLWSLANLTSSAVLQCNLDYPDPFGHSAHMGTRNSPENWSTYFSLFCHKTASVYHNQRQHCSCKCARPSVMPGNTPSAFGQWSPHSHVVNWPHPLCMRTSALLESGSVRIIEVPDKRGPNNWGCIVYSTNVAT